MKINEMVGKIFTGIEVDRKGDIIQFNCTNGVGYRFYHEQDCCESVTIEDINGDLEDLINTPLLVAEENTSNNVNEKYDTSHTWTFYKFGTVKGYVDIRWHGTSNGYYSESVYMKKILLDERDELTIYEIEYNEDLSSELEDIGDDPRKDKVRVFRHTLTDLILNCKYDTWDNDWEFELILPESDDRIQILTLSEFKYYIDKYKNHE